MPTLRYLHYDVFTTSPFEGNPLAVFLDATGLSTAQMQRLANEMNFSESTFVLPVEAAGTDVRMRIFTPGREMPMAGHPTVGTTFALAHEGTIASGQEQWVFGLNVGPTPVRLEWRDGALAHAWMDQGRPELRPVAGPAADVVRSIGADHGAWERTGLPVLEGSCGAPYFYVPLASRAAVDACQPDLAAMTALASAFPGEHRSVLVFSAEAVEPGISAYCRMFAPDAGVVEDPATGSAAGPLGAYLVRQGVVAVADAARIVTKQGVAMGRPSRLHVRVDAVSPGEITRVHVGGAAVRVGDGAISW